MVGYYRERVEKIPDLEGPPEIANPLNSREVRRHVLCDVCNDTGLRAYIRGLINS